MSREYYFPCSADHEQDWQPYPVDPYSAICDDHNGPVESGLSRAIKAGHAVRIEVNRLFPDVHLERLKGVQDPDGSISWMESVLWASEGFNCSATTVNSGMLSPHEIFREPPVDADFAVLQAGGPSRSAAEQTGPPNAPVFFPQYRIQPRERLLQNHGRGDREDRALARRHMAPTAGTVNFPGADSWIGRAPVTVRCRNTGIRAHSPAPCRYCYAYCHAGARVS